MRQTTTKDSDELGTGSLSIALIGPSEKLRQLILQSISGSQANVTKQLGAYPGMDDVPRLVEESYDVVMVELDSNPEKALDLVENLCGIGSMTVMVYASCADQELLVRCMRAGAREFLTEPLSQGMIAEALVRASVRRPLKSSTKEVTGKLMIFVGAKGGSGVTTVASNFAVSVAKDHGRNTLLIDLNIPLGDAALNLGLTAQYSVADALENEERLDYNYLSKLLTKHTSGLMVLAAPDHYTEVQASNGGLNKLLTVARQHFDIVVVDAGSRFAQVGKALFGQVTFTCYLVTQVSVSDLRNANRLIHELKRPHGATLEVVLNRFTPRSLGIDEDSITKALTVAPRWKIPSDYPAVRSSQNLATPLTMEDSPISRIIREMSAAATGVVAENKKKRFSLFG